jgi:hypothetical protein
LDIITESQTIRGHRLVIATRTDYWGELDEVSEIDFETTFDVANVILKWIYTDELEEERWGVLFLLDVLGVGHKFKLDSLTHR